MVKNKLRLIISGNFANQLTVRIKGYIGCAENLIVLTAWPSMTESSTTKVEIDWQ